jgi:hypothetical protein
MNFQDKRSYPQFAIVLLLLNNFLTLAKHRRSRQYLAVAPTAQPLARHRTAYR